MNSTLFSYQLERTIFNETINVNAVIQIT